MKINSCKHKNTLKFFISLFATYVLILTLLSLIGCTTAYKTDISTSIFDGKIELKQDEASTYFKDLEYGDSVNINTNNHTKLNNVPYLSTDFVNENDDVCYFSEKDNKYFLKSSHISYEGTTNIQVAINKKQNYIKLEDYATGKYTTEIPESTEEKQGVNFRQAPIADSDINIYRGANPMADNDNGATLNNYLKDNKVTNIVCLCFSASETNNYSTDHNTYYANLIDKNACFSADIKSFDFADKSIQKKFADALTYTINCNGNVYVHCLEGKDRTGFFCALAEAYYGTSYETIVDDYMQSMKCYHGVDKEADIDSYNAIKHSRIDKYLVDAFELESANELENINLEEKTYVWLSNLIKS